MILPQNLHDQSPGIVVDFTWINHPTHNLVINASHYCLKLAVWDLQIKGPGLCLIIDMGSLRELRLAFRHSIRNKGGMSPSLPEV